MNRVNLLRRPPLLSASHFKPVISPTHRGKILMRHDCRPAAHSRAFSAHTRSSCSEVPLDREVTTPQQDQAGSSVLSLAPLTSKLRVAWYGLTEFLQRDLRLLRPSRRTKLEGPSMLSTFPLRGCWALEDTWHITSGGELQKGDIVVLWHVGAQDNPYATMCKRVVGLPGDVMCDERGEKVQVQPGTYWVQGDNPKFSTDSRTFGPVPRRNIRSRVIGKVEMYYDVYTEIHNCRQRGVLPSFDRLRSLHSLYKTYEQQALKNRWETPYFRPHCYYPPHLAELIASLSGDGASVAQNGVCVSGAPRTHTDRETRTGVKDADLSALATSDRGRGGELPRAVSYD